MPNRIRWIVLSITAFCWLMAVAAVCLDPHNTVSDILGLTALFTFFAGIPVVLAMVEW